MGKVRGLGAIGFVCAWAIACGGSGSGGGPLKDGGADGSLGGGSGFGASGGFPSGGSGGVSGGAGGAGNSGGSGGTAGAAGGGAGGTGGGTSGPIPTTCAEATAAQSHFGCEFWPTVAPNLTWSIFDFAVIVANPGTASADITVTRGTTQVAVDKVNGKSTKTIYLPWVDNLKGGDTDNCGVATASPGSIRETGGAYRLVTTAPVAVFQHSPIEYQGVGGPAAKSWSACPGSTTCSTGGTAIGCFSFSNDSSLLLPTASLGKTYRTPGIPGLALALIGPNLTITATENTSKITVTLTAQGAVKAGGGLAQKNAGESFDVFLDRGDVFVVQAPETATLGGTLINSDKPIQVIGGASCAQVPEGTQACDHLEDVLLPAPAFGKHYLLPALQGPKGDQPGQLIQLVGHADGTTLTYPGGAPTGAPTALAAGEVKDLGLTTQAVEVVGNKGFEVVTYIPGGGILDPLGAAPEQLGDPSLRVAVPAEQFRSAYAVSLPPSYSASHIEVVLPTGAQLKLDGALVATAPAAFGSGSFGVLRLSADSNVEVLHMLEADQPFGVQVVGYGKYTSYAHPGGASVKTLP